MIRAPTPFASAESSRPISLMRASPISNFRQPRNGTRVLFMLPLVAHLFWKPGDCKILCLEVSGPADQFVKPNDAPSVLTQFQKNSSGAVALLTKQKALFYEEADAVGKPGSVTWRASWTSPRPGHAPEMSVFAEVDIPRQHGLLLTFARNHDEFVPASHMISITFTLPKDYRHDAIESVPGLLAQPEEATNGSALIGDARKMSDNFFIVYLSTTDAGRKRNLQLLKRPWLVIPFIYSDGVRAMIRIEKGTSGELLLNELFGL
jgi:hypothetical protein